MIAFGGRAIDKEVSAKYLNSPETPLFHKGAVLYNHHNARKAAHERGGVIAVEGYVDVIAMSVAGFPQRRGAARHGADARPMRAAVAHGGGADPLLRRRPGRPQGGLPRDRHGAAADRARARACASRFCRRAGPRRSRALRRPQAIARRARRREPLVDVLWTRETEGSAARHARAPRGAGAAPVGTDERRSATRPCAAIIATRSARGSTRCRAGRRAAATSAAAAQRRPASRAAARFGRGGAFQQPPSYTASPPSVSASLTRSRMFAARAGCRAARPRSCSTC